MTALTDLTPRKLEILQLVLAGKTNKEIAGEVCISVKTVEFHLDNIYKKLGVQTRLMAGFWAMQNGLRMEARETSNQSRNSLVQRRNSALCYNVSTIVDTYWR